MKDVCRACGDDCEFNGEEKNRLCPECFAEVHMGRIPFPHVPSWKCNGHSDPAYDKDESSPGQDTAIRRMEDA